MNSHQNQEIHSSSSSFNQIDINAFNADAALIGQPPQAANDDGLAASQDYTRPSQQFSARTWNFSDQVGLKKLTLK